MASAYTLRFRSPSYHKQRRYEKKPMNSLVIVVDDVVSIVVNDACNMINKNDDFLHLFFFLMVGSSSF
jgi:hypothetical protein